MRISDWSSDVCSSDLGRWCSRTAAWSERPGLDHRCIGNGSPVAPPAGGVRVAERVTERATNLPRSGGEWNRQAVRLPPFSRLLQDNGENHVSFMTRSEEHTSELQSLMRISYAVFCLKKKKQNT